MPRTVHPVGYVAPNEPATSRLGEGTYSLNHRSNVPYVRIKGSQWEKIITWGELVCVPRGENASIFNASYHGGDIFLNEGEEYCNRPARITVPVPMTRTRGGEGEGARAFFTSSYPCDTRGARRAYLAIDAYVVNANRTVWIRGRRLDGSHNSPSPLQYNIVPYGPGTGFLWSMTYIVGEVLADIPLGYGAVQGDDSRPHTLLDAADVFVEIGGPNAPLTDAFSWPATPPDPGFTNGETTDEPGTWFVIEY